MVFPNLAENPDTQYDSVSDAEYYEFSMLYVRTVENSLKWVTFIIFNMYIFSFYRNMKRNNEAMNLFL